MAAYDYSSSFFHKDAPLHACYPPLHSVQYAVAQLADAKGMFPEGHPRFMGTYWGAVSWPAVAEVVESADLVVTVGCVWTDYSSVGYSLLLKPEKVDAWMFG